MKYTDRKKTPLKWFHLMQFLILPLIIINYIYILLSMIATLGNISIPFVKEYLPALFTKLGISAFALGSYFWPIVILGLFVIIILILAICAWVGTFHYRSYMPVIWNSMNVIYSLLLVAITFISFRESAMIQEVIRYGSGSVNLTIQIFQVMLCVTATFEVIYTIVNFIYFQKRKALFADYYVIPSEQPVQKEQTPVEEAVQEEEPQTEAVPVEVVEPIEEEKTEHSEETATEETPAEQENTEPVAETPVSEEKSEETVETEELSSAEKQEETEPVIEEETEPITEEPAEVTEQKAEFSEETPAPALRFCPGCGKKLNEQDGKFCSACGYKLIS